MAYAFTGDMLAVNSVRRDIRREPPVSQTKQQSRRNSGSATVHFIPCGRKRRYVGTASNSSMQVQWLIPDGLIESRQDQPQ